jgi:hypothetical protein
MGCYTEGLLLTGSISPMKLASIASAVLALALFGCTDVSSTSLKTSGIHAYLGVTGTASGSGVASAELTVEGNTLAFVELKSGDSVTATEQSTTKTLSEESLLGVISYSATFDDAGAEGTSYTLALNRSSDTSAPHTVVTLPAVFNVTAPTGASLTYSRANDDIVVTYDHSGLGDAMSYTIDGPCINPVSQAISGDPGTFTVSKGSISLLGSSSTSCQATLTVLRTRNGTLDPAFSGGTAFGAQARTVTFTSNP